MPSYFKQIKYKGEIQVKRKSLVKVMAILLMVVMAIPMLAATINIRVVVSGEK